MSAGIVQTLASRWASTWTEVTYFKTKKYSLAFVVFSPDLNLSQNGVFFLAFYFSRNKNYNEIK